MRAREQIACVCVVRYGARWRSFPWPRVSLGQASRIMSRQSKFIALLGAVRSPLLQIPPSLRTKSSLPSLRWGRRVRPRDPLIARVHQRAQIPLHPRQRRLGHRGRRRLRQPTEGHAARRRGRARREWFDRAQRRRSCAAREARRRRHCPRSELGSRHACVAAREDPYDALSGDHRVQWAQLARASESARFEGPGPSPPSSASTRPRTSTAASQPASCPARWS